MKEELSRKYQAGDGTPCTIEEEKLIDSLKRLAAKWNRNGKDLMLFSWDRSLVVCKRSCMSDVIFSDGVIENIFGIPNDGGDPDDKIYLK